MSEQAQFMSDAEIELLLFGGKGGVGKTTMACATALRLASADASQSVLLVSTDPAHSVKDCLGELELPTNLTVAELDADAEHERFMAEHATHLAEIANRGTFLDSDDVDGLLSLSLPGVDELMAFLRLAEWVESESYDRVIVDTAPTGHALRLLGMPEFVEQWLEAMDALLAKHRYMLGLFGGGQQSDAVEDFLEEMAERVEGLSELLTDENRCRFVPVMIAERASVEETERLLSDLDEADIAAPEVVVNRLVPDGAGLDTARDRQLGELGRLPEELGSRAIYAMELDPAAASPDGLAELLERLIAPDAVAAAIDGRSSSAQGGCPSAIGQLDMTPPRSLYLVAGKGGVGKTTMAASLALAACRTADQRVLLVSTDPAGNLAETLKADESGVEISGEPSEVADGLDAMQIDAASDFEALQEQYADELETLIDSLAGGMDLAFDREAMERLLDLAPPGLDEVMALERVIGLLDSGEYGCIVLDTAPTGHLLRLLELPELVTAWLNGIFKLFVKYQHIFKLPKLQQKLVQLSKGVKALRAILTDPSRAALVAVTIPTRMAMEETGDLLEACERLEVAVAGVICNQITPTNAGELAERLSASEAPMIERGRMLSGTRDFVVVERSGDPRGIQTLSQLADNAFGTGTAGTSVLAQAA